MKRAVIFLILLASAPLARAVGPCSNTTIGTSTAVCRISHNGSGGTTSQAITFSTGYNAGETIQVWAEANSTTAFSATPSVNINNSDGYSWSIAKANCAGASQQTILYYFKVLTTNTASDTITVTNSGGSFIIVQGAAVTNLGAVDGTGGCGSTTASFTTTIGDISFGFTVGSSGVAAGSGWVGQDGTSFSVYETQVASGTSSTATFTGTAAVSIGVPFLPASSPVCRASVSVTGAGSC